MTLRSIGFFICQTLLFLVLIALPAAYLFGCYASDWKCSGDSMGGIMMVYAFTLFPLSLFGVPIFGYFYIKGVRKLKNEGRFLLSHAIGLYLNFFALYAVMIVLVYDFL